MPRAEPEHVVMGCRAPSPDGQIYRRVRPDDEGARTVVNRELTTAFQGISYVGHRPKRQANPL